MKQRTAVVVTVLAVTTTAPAVAHAEPVVPQPDTQCSENLTGALTQLPDGKTLVQCRGSRWHIVDDPYPNSDRWLTYGPRLTLHGEGMRNREINSGDWIAYPQDSGSWCNAELLVVVSAGKLSAPQVSKGEPGRSLKLRVPPLLFTIELSGYCLWQKVQ
jgi:hypothetical protein